MSHALFDFDGVIGNTYDTNWELVQEIFPGVDEQTYRIDHHLGNVYEHPAVPFTAETAARYIERIRLILSTEHIADAVPALQQIGQDRQLHIVTSNCEVAIERVLTEAGVDHLFGHILGQGAHLSKVAKFKTISEAIGTELSEFFYVTDTLGDIVEAQKVSLQTIAVTFGYHPRELLQIGNPTHIVDTWDEVTAILK